VRRIGNHCKLHIENGKLQIGAREAGHSVLRTQFSPFSPSPPLPLSRSRFSARRGVSLMEVLVSIFIIMFGLLGVAALLPVGRFEIIEAAKRDRAAACGRSVLRDAKIRRMINPDRWLAFYDNFNPYPGWSGGGPVTPAWMPVSMPENTLQHYAAYAIDPLFLARALTENAGLQPTAIARFPFTAPNGTPYMGRCSYVGDPGTLQALVQAIMSGNQAPVVQYVSGVPRFDRLFHWQDDQSFDLPTDVQQRPSRLFDAGGAGQFEGYYSWLITVAPAVSEAGTLAGNRHLYEVSVVVLFQRDFSAPTLYFDPDKPPERMVGVTFLGSGWGGGDVTLSKLQPNDPAGMLDIRENEWILVGTIQPLGGGFRKVFRWYRVAAIEEQNPSTPQQRMATLAGPDWPVTTLGNAAAGIICTGVVGVYSQNMEIE